MFLVVLLGTAISLFGFLLILFAGPIALVIMVILAMIFAHATAMMMFAVFLLPAELLIMLFRGSTLFWTQAGAYSAAYDSLLAWPGSLLAWLTLVFGGFALATDGGAMWDDFKQGMAAHAHQNRVLTVPVKKFSKNPEVNAAIAAVMARQTRQPVTVAWSSMTPRQQARAERKQHDIEFKALIKEMQQIGGSLRRTEEQKAYNRELQAMVASGEATITYRTVSETREGETIWEHIPDMIGGLHRGVKSVVKGAGMATVAVGAGVATVGVLQSIKKR